MVDLIVRRNRVPRGLFVSGLVAFLAACSGAETIETQDFSVRDSAGIQVSENSRTSVEDVPTLRLVEALRIGTVSGNPEEEFEFLTDLAVGEGGEIFALDSRARAIRVFGFDGSALRRFGGAGEGPGEFQNELLRIALGGDSVVVQDRFRFNVFASDGEFLTSTVQRLTRNRPAALLAWTPESWLFGQPVTSAPRSSRDRTTVDTFRISPMDLTDGTAGVAVLEVPSTIRRYLPDMERSREQWMGPTVEAAVRPNGELYLTKGDDYEIEVFSPTGHLLRIIRADVERTPVSEGDFQSAATEARFRFGLDEIRELGHPDERPIPGRILVGPSGGFLVKRLDLSSLPGASPEGFREVWDVFLPNGRVAGRLTTDRSIRPRVFTDEFLYAIVRDDLDVQYIVRFGGFDLTG